ncbi:MAG TPA: hypothetical protein VD978_11140 [Azospirillum sp.]|nr:hypothetical protein [Azospirillum sp.]
MVRKFRVKAPQWKERADEHDALSAVSDHAPLTPTPPFYGRRMVAISVTAMVVAGALAFTLADRPSHILAGVVATAKWHVRHEAAAMSSWVDGMMASLRSGKVSVASTLEMGKDKGTKPGDATPAPASGGASSAAAPPVPTHKPAPTVAAAPASPPPSALSHRVVPPEATRSSPISEPFSFERTYLHRASTTPNR